MNVLLGFASTYALFVLLILLLGHLIGSRTRGAAAQRLLGPGPDHLIVPGESFQFPKGPLKTRLYVLILLFGVVLFHGAVLLLMAAWVLAVYIAADLIMRLQGQLTALFLFLVICLSLLWTLVHLLLAFPARAEPGLPVNPDEHPRWHDVLTELGHRLEVQTVKEVRLVPGTTIQLHRQGRGPFGLLGVRRRVLLLGWSAVRLLTVSELQSLVFRALIPASRKNTFAARFLPRAVESIQESLATMRRQPRRRLHVQVFYWILAAYHGAYAVLAAPYFRSRELLADRLTSCLFGADVFTSALTRLTLDASLFEMALHDLAAHPTQAAGKNAFQEVPHPGLSPRERDELSAQLRRGASGLADPIPNFGERLETVALLPRATHTESGQAIFLFEKPERVEVALTAFLLKAGMRPDRRRLFRRTVLFAGRE